MYLFQSRGVRVILCQLGNGVSSQLASVGMLKAGCPNTFIHTKKVTTHILIFVLILLLSVFQNIDKVSRFKEHMRREMQTALELEKNPLHFPENDTTYLVRLAFTDLT